MDYYDRHGHPISQEAGVKLLEDITSRLVANTKVSDGGGKLIEISTVHLVLDHGFGRGPAVIFETMVFGPGREALTCYRYSTDFEASQGHSRAVNDVLQERGGTVIEYRACPLVPGTLIIEEDWSS